MTSVLQEAGDRHRAGRGETWRSLLDTQSSAPPMANAHGRVSSPCSKPPPPLEALQEETTHTEHPE